MDMGIDVYPNELIPFLISDYATKSLIGLFYSPLVSSKDRHSLSTVYKKNDLEWELVLKDNVKWSNGENVKLSDILNTWKYILDTKQDFAKELDWLRNWKNVRKGKGTFDDIGLLIENDTLHMSLEYIVDVKKLLSNIGFTPVYIDNGKFFSFCTGAFIPSNSTNYNYRYNHFFYPFISKDLNLILNDSPQSAIDNYVKGKTEITPTTLFDSRLLDKVEGFQISRKSNIHAGFILLSDKSKKYKYFFQERVGQAEYNLQNLSKCPNFFYSTEAAIWYNSSSLIKDNKIKEIFHVALTDYYPNVEVATHLLKGLKVNFSIVPLECLKSEIKNNRNLDLAYVLFTTTVINELSLLLSYIPWIEEENVEDYINLLNKYDVNNLSLEEKTIINRFLEEYCYFIPIGNISHRYKCKSQKILLEVDDNDTYYFRR